MGCGVCKSQACEDKIVEPEAALSVREVPENRPRELPKLFIVKEEPSSLEESVRKLDSRVFLHVSLQRT